MQVAFFRNLNLGQPRSPSRVELVAAFEAEGATDVLSHQSNGTLAFSAPAGADPVSLASSVANRLGPTCSYADVVLVRSLGWLRGLDLADLPNGCELTLFDGPAPFPEPLPWTPAPEATVLRADGLHAIVHNHAERRSLGTRVLETRLGVPATSRGVGTVLRLLDRLS
ncbi:MAG: DUF1697 domain-containing protein [Terrabacter sp.]